MGKKAGFWILMLATLPGIAWAQDDSAQPSGSVPQDSSQQPAPAYGADTQLTPMTENPPLSGLDIPGLEPHAAPLSYLQPGVSVSETLDSNVANSLGQSAVHSVSEVLGSVALQRLWSRYALVGDYLGGAAYYNARGIGWKMLQQGDFEYKVTWRRGQLALRDTFNYLPEGNFGVQYGAIGTPGITPAGVNNFGTFWGGNTFGGLGQVPRIWNLALGDVTENLSPRSALTGAVGYAFTHYTENPVPGSIPLLNNKFLGGSQLSAQAGYNHILNAHDQIALVYGYQAFDFTAQGTAFHSHVIQGMYGHRVSGRMDFLVGAGPQITKISSVSLFGPVSDTRLGVAARAQLRYRFPRTIMELSFERFETNGSGFFAGAQTNVAQARFTRPMSRRWHGFVDLGYSQNSRLQPLATNAVLANRYTYGFAGLGARRFLSRRFVLFMSYQFNELAFDNSFCAAQGVQTCNRMSQRHLVTLGVEWTPRPIRLD